MLERWIFIEWTASWSWSSPRSSPILAIVIWRPLWRVIGTIHFTWRAHGTVQTRRRRTPRSRFDRAAIAHLSPRNCSYLSRRRSTETLDHDRGPIVAQSWPNRGSFEVKSAAKSGSNRRGIEAMTYAYGIAPTKPWNCLHNRFNWPRSSVQFPSLKACISLLCSLTFDRFVKKLN